MESSDKEATDWVSDARENFWMQAAIEEDSQAWSSALIKQIKFSTFRIEINPNRPLVFLQKNKTKRNRLLLKLPIFFNSALSFSIKKISKSNQTQFLFEIANSLQLAPSFFYQMIKAARTARKMFQYITNVSYEFLRKKGARSAE